MAVTDGAAAVLPAVQTDTNERQFGVLRSFLTEHDAGVEVWEALDGLYGRWQLGREVNRQRLLAWRSDRERLQKLEGR